MATAILSAPTGITSTTARTSSAPHFTAAPELYQACAAAEALLSRQRHHATDRTEEGRTLLARREALATASYWKEAQQ